MNQPKHPILCGTDFSPTAREAADIAAGLAKRLETKLILIHSDEVQGTVNLDPAVFEAITAKERRELNGEKKRLREIGVTVEAELRSGSAFDELITAATDHNAQLIVIGAVGHKIGRRLLVGSVAERTAGTSPIPTLVVRPNSNFPSWFEGKHPLRILVGYDFSEASDAALRWIKQMEKINPCVINVFHSAWPPDQTRQLGEHEKPLPSTDPSRTGDSLEAELSQRVAMILPTGNVTLTIESGWGQAEAYLYEKAHNWKADLVVVGSHQRQGLDRFRFGSVSRAVLHHATVPVAVIPPKIS